MRVGNRQGGLKKEGFKIFNRSHFLRSPSGPTERWEIHSGKAGYKLKVLRASDGTCATLETEIKYKSAK